MRVYVARQPIYNSDQSLFGYELLYRDNDENAFRMDVDGSMATRAVISDAVVSFGLQNLTHGKYAFINFTRPLLMNKFPLLLDPQEFVIELLEDVVIDDALLERLDELRQKKYLLALDDYVGQECDREIERMDIIKVDFKLTSPRERTRIARKYVSSKRLLAEKVETVEEYERAKSDGYTLFQGFLFARPTIFSKNSMEIASSTYMRILKEIINPAPDFDTIARTIQLDVNLMYKFLHRINTLSYYRGHRVFSVKHALVRMGLNEIRRWAMLILLRDAVNKPQDEIIRTALVRGIFAEKVAEIIHPDFECTEAYTAGMFSVIDAVLEEDLTTILDELCITDDVRAALLGEQTALGEILSFVRQYETADWDRIDQFFKKYRVSKSAVSHYYLEAVRYADLAFDDTSNDLDIRGEDLPDEFSILD